MDFLVCVRYPFEVVELRCANGGPTVAMLAARSSTVTSLRPSLSN